MEFIIMFSIRKISDDSKYRKDMFKSKRKSAEEIWEGVQIPGVSDIVRFAPSACNSQPWLVKNDGELSVYRYRKPGKRGIMPADKVSFYNRIDIGIFICFIHRFQYQYWTRSSSLHHSIWSESGGWRWKTGNTFFDWQGEKVLNLPLLQTIKWNDFAWFFYLNHLTCYVWRLCLQL